MDPPSVAVKDRNEESKRALVVLWCNMRANAGEMLVLWKNAEKGASVWLECAAHTRTNDRGFVLSQDMGGVDLYKADLPCCIIAEVAVTTPV